MNNNQNLIIVADLGQLKAYTVSVVRRKDTAETGEPVRKASESLTLVTDIDYINAHLKAGEQVSDKDGNFVGSNGEPHDRLKENDKRILKNICNDIEKIVTSESHQAWCLAFPKAKNRQLNEMLSQQVKKTLRKSISSDLTKIAKDKLLSHFD